MRTAAGALIAAIFLAGCGGSAKPAGPPAEAAAAPPAQLQAASCRDWMRDGDQGRRTLLGKLRAAREMQISGDGVPGVASGVRAHGSVLSDDVATRVLNGYCMRPRSERLRLYKLYSFAANYVGGR